jgi:hypothetical protein
MQDLLGLLKSLKQNFVTKYDNIALTYNSLQYTQVRRFITILYTLCDSSIKYLHYFKSYLQ